MTNWLEEYTDTDDLNRKYTLLRGEITRRRGQRDDIEFFDPDSVGNDGRRLNETVDSALIVFVANDFGMPGADAVVRSTRGATEPRTYLLFYRNRVQ